MRIRDWSSDVGSSDLFGADVTIVNRSDQILRGYDEQIRDRLLQISMTKGIQFRFNAPFRKVEKKADGSLSVHLGSGDPVDCDILMFATGRVPNTDGLGLEAAGVELRSEERRVGEECVSRCRSRWSP